MTNLEEMETLSLDEMLHIGAVLEHYILCLTDVPWEQKIFTRKEIQKQLV